MYKIKIVEKRPITQPEICKQIVNIFAKNKLKISIEEERHLWDLLARDKGMGWLTYIDRSDKDIFDSFEPYYFVDKS